MIVGVGIDLVEISRIQRIYERHPRRFLERVLTEDEQAYVLQYKDQGQRLAGRWAAKEAALKALGTGLQEGWSWRDVEILPDERGKPRLTLHGEASATAARLGANVSHVSISHSDTMAMAQVIFERVETR